MFGGVDSYGLIAIPLFILIGEIMNGGGITRRIVDLAMAVVGSLQGRAGLREHPGQHVRGLHPGFGHGAGRDHVADHGARDGEAGLRQGLRRRLDRLWRHARPDHPAVGHVRGLQHAGAGVRQRHADRRHPARHPSHAAVLRRHRAAGLRLQLPARRQEDAQGAGRHDPEGRADAADPDRDRRLHPQRPGQRHGERSGRRRGGGPGRQVLDQGIPLLAPARR